MLLLIALGCSVIPATNCNMMFMESGLSIEIDGDLEPGDYVFEATDGDGLLIDSCAFTLPDAEGMIHCEASRVEFLDADTLSSWRLMEETPEDVDVVLLDADDAELLSESFTGIEYEETEYNGRNCSYAYKAEVTLAL